MIDWVRSIGGMLLAGENRINGDNRRYLGWQKLLGIRSSPSATLYTISLTGTDLGSKPVLPGKRPTISCQRHDRATWHWWWRNAFNCLQTNVTVK